MKISHKYNQRYTPLTYSTMLYRPLTLYQLNRKTQ